MFNQSTVPYSIPVSPVAYTTGGNGGNGMFGGDEGILGILLIIALLGGFGNGGFGGGFGGGGAQRDYVLATDFATIERKLDSVNSGICDATFALNNTIVNGNNALNNTMTQGFAGLNTALVTQGYENRIATNAVGTQVAQCCCDLGRSIERGFADTNYNMATQACDTRHAIADSTRDILESQNANTRSILDFLVKDKIETLQVENQSLRLKASQEAQNNYLISQLGDKCPVPAYVVNGPTPVNFPTNCCNTFSGYGYNSCGCGCN